MEIRKTTDPLRDEAGFILCGCGCRERFFEGEDVAYIQAPLPANGRKDLHWAPISMRPTAVLKLKHVLSDRDGDLKERLLALSREDPRALRSAYLFMHDALGCRI